MIDLTTAHLAMRNRALSLTVATTGSMSLSATATGYERAAGSFLADNFAVGMEITPSGFATNSVDVITAVSELAITTSNTHTAEAAAGGRVLRAGIPAQRAFENVPLDPTSGRPYIEEDFVPATHSLSTFPAEGASAEETGLYVLKWYGLSGKGISAIRRSIDALKQLFAPGTVISAGADTVRVRSDTAPQTGQIIPLTTGYSVLVLTIPWRADSINLVAA